MTLPDERLGDKGQRYETWCVDGSGKDMRVGWGPEPNAWLNVIALHPSWHSPRVIDRETGEEVEIEGADDGDE